MLAMCVRKPGDSSVQSHVHSTPQTATATATVQLKSSRKQKSSALKVLKRGGKSDVTELTYSQQQQQQQAIPPASRIPPPSTSTGSLSSRVAASTPSKVRDDPEGHLIYSRGDRLEARCKHGGWGCWQLALQPEHLSVFMIS